MGKIFLIYSNTDDYDTHNAVLGYATSEDEAKAVVEALKEEYRHARLFNDSIHELKREFEKENPSPLIGQNLVDVPRWPSGIGKDSITPEMRAERLAIAEKNQKTIQENSMAYAEWQTKQMEFVKPLIEPVVEEPWFKKWFIVGDRFISCTAHTLINRSEYIYEECEKFIK